MSTEKATKPYIDIKVGQKWINTENGVEFIVFEIDGDLIGCDDGKKTLRSKDWEIYSNFRYAINIELYKLLEE